MVNRDAEMQITKEDVLKIYIYDPETGYFWWKERGPARRLDSPAGGINTKGYRVLLINCRLYMAHRVAWFITYGEWPNLIDHIDGWKNNNRISNLRSVTQAQNTQNRGISKRNKSGHTGVYFNKKRNRYLVTLSSKVIGWFKTLDEAINARKKAEEQYFTHCRQ